MLHKSRQSACLYAHPHNVAGQRPGKHVPAATNTRSRVRVRVRVRVRDTLRLSVYRQLVHLGAKPLETHGQIFFCQLTTCCHSPYVTSSRRLQLLLGLASEFILRSESRRPHDHVLLSQIRDSLPQPRTQVPVFISPRNRVTQLCPPVLGSLSVAFYDSQGYGGGNSNPPPHPGGPVCYALTHKFEGNRIQNIA
jgi:hypothetical protein